MNTPRTLLLVIEALTIGGAERVVVDLATHLPRTHWQPHVLCLTKPGELAAELPDYVPLHCLQKKPGLDLPLIGRIRSLVREIRPSLINTHLWTANTWMRAAIPPKWQIPLIVTEHNRDTWKRWHHRWIDRHLQPRMARMVAVSEDAATFYRDTVGISPENISTIHNGIDTARYRAGECWRVRSEFGLDENTPLIGTVGRLVPQKNPFLLLDAFTELKKEVPALRCLFAGDGPLLPSLRNRVAELQLTDAVLLPGPRGDVPDILAALDLFVLSSDREGHPLTALEAQAAGVPVVLTDVGGSAQTIVRDGEQTGGVLVPPNNADALANAILELLQDSQKRHRMADTAREGAGKAFDVQQMIRHYDDLFCSLLPPRIEDA